MTRVKRGVAASKRRKNLLKDAKGYRWNRKNLFREAKQAVIKAGKYAYRDRRAQLINQPHFKVISNQALLGGICR